MKHTAGFFLTFFFSLNTAICQYNNIVAKLNNDSITF
jgi:hypothetical protein